MSQPDELITRRDFLVGASCAGLALAMGLPLSVGRAMSAESEKTARVVLVRDQHVIGKSGQVNAEIASDMLDRAVASLVNTEDAVAAWRKLINADDIVGIKSNEWHYLPTPPEIEQAIRKRLIDSGVSEDHISMDDRGVLDNPVFAAATALVNVRPLRTHHWAGIGGCLKNYIMFVPEPSTYHGNSCANLASIWKLPLVNGKTRLNILVLFTPLFYGIGPHHFDSTYTWRYNGLLVGTDPVAVDAIGVKLIEAKRAVHFGKPTPIKPPPHHVAYADIRHGLGVSDLSKIELIKLGWEEDVLI